MGSLALAGSEARPGSGRPPQVQKLMQSLNLQDACLLYHGLHQA